MQIAVMFVALNADKLSFFGTRIATLPSARKLAFCLGVHYTDIVNIIAIKKALPRNLYRVSDISLIDPLISAEVLGKHSFERILCCPFAVL